MYKGSVATNSVKSTQYVINIELVYTVSDRNQTKDPKTPDNKYKFRACTLYRPPW